MGRIDVGHLRWIIDAERELNGRSQKVSTGSSGLKLQALAPPLIYICKYQYTMYVAARSVVDIIHRHTSSQTI